MASVGGLSVFSVDTPIPMAGLKTITVTRPGVDGHSVIDTGVHALPGVVAFRANYSSNVNRDLARIQFMNLAGTIITVVDSHGTSWLLLLVNRMTERDVPRGRVAMKTPVGGGAYWLHMEMELQPLATSY